MTEQPESSDRVDPRDLAIRLMTVLCLVAGTFVLLVLT
jgi:hypothetical protein